MTYYLTCKYTPSRWSVHRVVILSKMVSLYELPLQVESIFPNDEPTIDLPLAATNVVDSELIVSVDVFYMANLTGNINLISAGVQYVVHCTSG